jgi:hypothetical protein
MKEWNWKGHTMPQAQLSKNKIIRLFQRLDRFMENIEHLKIHRKQGRCPDGWAPLWYCPIEKKGEWRGEEFYSFLSPPLHGLDA